jgi:hypothetical protein
MNSSSDDGQTVLERRVEALDGRSFSTTRRASLSLTDLVDDDIVTFIGVLDEVTTTGDHSLAPVLTAAMADEVVSACQMLGRIGSVVPEIVSGQFCRNSQYWVSTGKPPWVRPPQQGELSRSVFVAANNTSRGWVKPRTSGLYTSTGYLGTQGMWRKYLELQSRSSSSLSLFQLPWYVWQLQVEPAARVAEIGTASDWADLVTRFQFLDDGLAYPDWLAVASEYDAVHVTLPAIAAMDGIRLRTPEALLAPSYWGVECTLWLGWSFRDISRAETIRRL